MAEDRYSRQERFAPFGNTGQAALGRMRVAIIGVGALGSLAAELLVRAGVGSVRVVDRDIVEWSNLQRQSLYDEADARACLPKVHAAAQRLQAINHAVTIESELAHVDADNVEALVRDVDLVIDGADGFALRHLVNEACCKHGIVWIYGACVGSYACALPIQPGRGPCLACLQEELPAIGESPTCDSVGVIAPAVHQVAVWQVSAALRLAAGEPLGAQLHRGDCWQGWSRSIDVAHWRRIDCPACGEAASYPHLVQRAATVATLCGRDAFQFPGGEAVDLDRLAAQLDHLVILRNPYLLRWQADGVLGTCFRDGRVLIQGARDLAHARAHRDRYLGG